MFSCCLNAFLNQECWVALTGAFFSSDRYKTCASIKHAQVRALSYTASIVGDNGCAFPAVPAAAIFLAALTGQKSKDRDRRSPYLDPEQGRPGMSPTADHDSTSGVRWQKADPFQTHGCQ